MNNKKSVPQFDKKKVIPPAPEAYQTFDSLSCPKCGTERIVYYIVIKGYFAVLKVICPQDYSRQIIKLPLELSAQWIGSVADAIYRCAICGMQVPNPAETICKGHWMILFIKCPLHGLKEAKRYIMDKIYPLIQNFPQNLAYSRSRDLEPFPPKLKKSIEEKAHALEPIMDKSIKEEAEILSLKHIEDIAEMEIKKLKDFGITKIEDLIDEYAPEIAIITDIDEERIQKWIDRARELKGLPCKLKKSIVEKGPIPQPTMDEMVNQSMNMVIESNLTPELNIEEVAPPVSKPHIEEVAPPASKPTIRGAQSPVSKPIVERLAHRAPELKCSSCGSPTTKYEKLCEDCVRKREKQIAQLLFICKKCRYPQITVQKMEKNDFSQIITSTKCPKCGNSTQLILDSLKIGDWIEPLKQSFFKCGKCGSDCKVVKTEMKNNRMKVTLYCEVDWTEIQKEIPIALFQVLMTQIQKA